MAGNTGIIAVTGATGQLGRLTVDNLLRRGVPAEHIVALVRNPQKAADLAARGIDVRVADYNDPAGLATALRGIEKLLLISANEMGQRARQHRNVIEAAGRVGVPFVAYTSLLRADTSPLGLAEEHRQTEAALRDSGLAYTLLRNGWYTENYITNIHGAVAQGALVGSSGTGRIASATRADYAEAAAVVLASDDHAGQVYELAGDQAWTMADLAAAISRVVGREIPYRDVPVPEYAAILSGAGMPAPIAQMFAEMETLIAQGALFDDSHTLSRLIGRPTTPLAQAVAQMLGS